MNELLTGSGSSAMSNVPFVKLLSRVQQASSPAEREGECTHIS